jgi:sortase (surface protein transpeptidase)
MEKYQKICCVQLILDISSFFYSLPSMYYEINTIDKCWFMIACLLFLRFGIASYPLSFQENNISSIIPSLTVEASNNPIISNNNGEESVVKDKVPVQKSASWGDSMIVSDLNMKGTPIIQKWIKTIVQAKVDTTPPKRFKPSNTKDLNYWLNVLPFKEDREKESYIVLPSVGIIAPIIYIPEDSNDYKAAKRGESVDMNRYFLGGVSLYPTSALPWNVGNAIIWWHSNYRYKDKSNYRTIFTKMPELNVGQEVWFYRKIDWKWNFFRFTIKKSYEVSDLSTDIMKPTKWKTETTLYTCTPIGTAKKRWIVKAELLSQEIISL